MFSPTRSLTVSKVHMMCKKSEETASALFQCILISEIALVTNNNQPYYNI